MGLDCLLQIREREQVLGPDTGIAEGLAELGPQRKVLAGDVGQRDVQCVLGLGVAAEVGEDDGRAEGVEVWEEARARSALLRYGQGRAHVQVPRAIPADSLPTTKVNGVCRWAAGAVKLLRASARKARRFRGGGMGVDAGSVDGGVKLQRAVEGF